MLSQGSRANEMHRETHFKESAHGTVRLGTPNSTGQADRLAAPTGFLRGGLEENSLCSQKPQCLR